MKALAVSDEERRKLASNWDAPVCREFQQEDDETVEEIISKCPKFNEEWLDSNYKREPLKKELKKSPHLHQVWTKKWTSEETD